MVDVCLVQMPFSALTRASIALSLLKTYLNQAHLTSWIYYPNFDFAEALGLDVYSFIEIMPPENLLGEWVFAQAAFPQFKPDDDAFIKHNQPVFNSTLAKYLTYYHEGLDVVAMMYEVRQRVDGFLEQTARAILQKNPRVVGCTSMFQQHCASLALLRRIKQMAPHVVTLLGGANCEGPMGWQTHRSFEWVDFVASGDVDGFFGEFCRALVDKGTALSVEEIPFGVRGPAHRNQAVDKPQRASFTQMDQVAIPNFDDYFQTLAAASFAADIVPGLPVETSRGCWWGMKHHCTFCGLNGGGMAFRSKSPTRVGDELDFLIKRHGVSRLELVDNILERQYLEDATLKKRLGGYENLHIFVEVKPLMKRLDMERLAAAGMRWIQPGLETMDSGILKMLDKGNTPHSNIQVLKWGQELGMRVFWNVLYGIPGESDEAYHKMAQWLPLLYHLPPARCCGRIRYDRFSPYHQQQERFGIELEPNVQHRYLYPLGDEELQEFAYFFEDYNDLSRGPIDATRPGEPRPGLNALEEVIKVWNRLYWPRKKGRVRPELTMREEGDRLILTDTRPAAPQPEVSLSGVAKRVYQICDHPLSRESLQRRCDREGLAASAVDAVLDELIAGKTLLFLDQKYQSLAIPPARDLPPRKEAPWGFIDYVAVMREAGEKSLAHHCAKQPGGEPCTTTVS